jgi:CRP-like cAMP-binding protein
MEAINQFIKPIKNLSAILEEGFSNGTIPYVTRQLGTGDYLFREGEETINTFYITKGLVRLFSVTEDGYSKTLFYHKAKTLIGFQYFREDPHSILNAVCCTPCEVFAIRSTGFRTLLIHNAEASFAMNQYVFEMMALLAREAVNASLFSVLQRLAALLIVLAEEQNGGAPPVLIPYSNQELAEMLGVHRNSVTNAVSSLKAAGCIEKKNSGLIIVYFGKLKSIAKGLTPQRTPEA